MKTKANSIHLLALTGAATLGLFLALPGRAHAIFKFTLTETTAGVTVTCSGTINVTDLTADNFIMDGPTEILPFYGLLAVGSSPNSGQEYDGITGPADFGSGGETDGSGAGDLVVVVGAGGILYVPGGYVSGSPLTDSALFSGATFDSLGFTPGTYTYTWGTGNNADSMIVNVAPEPSTWAMLGLGGVVGLSLARRRRQRRQTI